MPGGGAFPNLVVIGAMKCGTSSLHYYLGLHPEIQMSQPKELHFFLARESFDPEPHVTNASQRAALEELCAWGWGLDWYREHFSAEFPVRGESTPGYTFPWYRGVAGRIASVIPDAKLIYVVRDPVDRMASHYLTHRQIGREARRIEDALGAPASWYLAASRYATVIGPFLERFDRSRVLILRHEDLRDRRQETVARVFGFLGVDATFWAPEMETVRNRSAAKGTIYALAERLRATRRAGQVIQGLPASVKVRAERLLTAGRDGRRGPVVPVELRARLIERLAPEIAALEEITGFDLTAWRQAETASAGSQRR